MKDHYSRIKGLYSDVFGGKTDFLERPMRVSTAQGERVCLARSETVPTGSTVTFTVTLLKDNLESHVYEWFDYGKLRGIGQWRNSGKGRFSADVS